MKRKNVVMAIWDAANCSLFFLVFDFLCLEFRNDVENTENIET